MLLRIPMSYAYVYDTKEPNQLQVDFRKYFRKVLSLFLYGFLLPRRWSLSLLQAQGRLFCPRLLWPLSHRFPEQLRCHFKSEDPSCDLLLRSYTRHPAGSHHPYRQYTLFFILAVLCDHFIHLIPIEAICEKYNISSVSFAIILFAQVRIRTRLIWQQTHENQENSWSPRVCSIFFVLSVNSYCK